MEGKLVVLNLVLTLFFLPTVTSYRRKSDIIQREFRANALFTFQTAFLLSRKGKETLFVWILAKSIT